MFSNASRKTKAAVGKGEMEALTSQEEQTVNWLMAEEFLRNHLGINITKENVDRFVTHIVQFEREIAHRHIKNVA